MTDDCLADLTELIKNNPSLTKLELNGNRFSASGLETIRDVLVEADKESILGELSDNESEGDEDDEDEDDSESGAEPEDVVEALSKLKI